jgi:phage shock protein A
MITLEELSKMDFRGAMDLLFAYTTDLKRIEKEYSEALQNADLWNSRVTLAQSKGLADLAEAARKQSAATRAQAESLDSSRSELALDISRIKEALPTIKSKERSIDPDTLAAELAMMTGEALDPEKAKLEKELSAIDSSQAVKGAESALAALKRKMGL